MKRASEVIRLVMILVLCTRFAAASGADRIAETGSATSASIATPAVADRPLEHWVPGRVTRLNTIALSGPSSILLAWDPSCSPRATDYAVYEGILGDFASHVPRLCSTGGQLSASIPASPGSSYYLVVPIENGLEGSYGVASNGAERPQVGGVCYAQFLNYCF